MGFPITTADTPVVIDTLPALKTSCFFGPARIARIYTMARFYFERGDLCFSLAAFEKDPLPESRACLLLGTGEGQPWIQLVAAPDGVRWRSIEDGSPDLFTDIGGFAPLDASPIGGADEQGWYWGMQGRLPAAVLARQGIVAQPDHALFAAVYKYQTDRAAFGASLAFEGAQPPFPTGTDPFPIVSY